MTENKKKIYTYILVTFGIVFLVIMVLYDCFGEKYKLTENVDIAMGTVVTQKIYSKNDCSELINEINDLIDDTEKEISWRISGSYTQILNDKHFVEGNEKFADLMRKCNEVYLNSEGKFDITIGALSSLWNIGEDNAKVPKDEEIQKALSSVDGKLVRISDNIITCGKNQKIDLGAVGKGLTCDYIKEKLDNSSVYGAVVSVGGSILLYGNNPDSETWSVAVRNPRGDSSDTLGFFRMKEGFVSTSGDYERVLIENGKSYHHILDAKTGYPSDNELMSVTVICGSGFLSDALSTAAFVIGKEKGIKLLQKYNAEGIFVEKNYAITLTSGLTDNFTLTDSRYTLEGNNG